MNLVVPMAMVEKHLAYLVSPVARTSDLKTAVATLFDPECKVFAKTSDETLYQEAVKAIVPKLLTKFDTLSRGKSNKQLIKDIDRELEKLYQTESAKLFVTATVAKVWFFCLMQHCLLLLNGTLRVTYSAEDKLFIISDKDGLKEKSGLFLEDIAGF